MYRGVGYRRWCIEVGWIDTVGGLERWVEYCRWSREVLDTVGGVER